MTAELPPNADDRARRIAEIRRQIAAGEYDTPERLEAALDGLVASGHLAAAGEAAARDVLYGDADLCSAPQSDEIAETAAAPSARPAPPPHFRRPR